MAYCSFYVVLMTTIQNIIGLVVDILKYFKYSHVTNPLQLAWIPGM